MKTYQWLYVSVILILTFFACNNAVKETREKKMVTDVKTDTILDTRTERIITYKNMVDSVNKVFEWKELSVGLWQSKNGDLGFKTQEGTMEGIFIVKYISKLCCEGERMAAVIDTSSFKYLGSSFYKDKNHIYTHYETASGGNFWIVEEADVATFRILGDCYAKDKNHIYGERAMVMDSVDYKTFKTKKGIGCIAKDKNNYYFWANKMDPEEVTDDEFKNNFDELNKAL